MPGVKHYGLAASFDLECYGLDPVYGRLLCGVIKPFQYGEPQIYRIAVPGNDDSALTATLVEELSKYSILFAHNGLWFDRAMLNGRALAYGLPILDPKHKIVDPFQIARKHLNTKRNSLDALTNLCHIPESKMHVDAEMWCKVAFDHDEEAFKIIIERCVSDVRILEELAIRTLPFMGNINPFGSA